MGIREAMKEENIEHPTSNIQRPTGYALDDNEHADRVEERVFDLEDRLLDYAAAIIRLVEDLPKTRAGNHVAAQLLRSGTSPLPNHGEAESAESPADFVHKLKICLKELRETKRWLRLVVRIPMRSSGEVDSLLQETIELIRIFAASIRTAEKRGNQPKDRER
jgi:four helix bundle protein